MQTSLNDENTISDDTTIESVDIYKFSPHRGNGCDINVDAIVSVSLIKIGQGLKNFQGVRSTSIFRYKLAKLFYPQGTLRDNGFIFDAPIVPITGDGNCLFRAFSYLLSGTEDYHEQMRSTIVNELKEHHSFYGSYMAKNEVCSYTNLYYSLDSVLGANQ